ncbi:hypothetical protein B0H17DRAFT_956081 [Mycena rosella]|uniref:Uncharacterized protein n=1 Tax=Mycena rosella TaxID=1033263 RepID=A0AAD7CPG9_MYCRO|nr:hypothetical protein B0H17DRAFT_956081 [Mycena rosella]
MLSRATSSIPRWLLHHLPLYQFKCPICKVAIIGAGVSYVGFLAYWELVDAGFETVRIFDRDAVPGGNWHYTETPVTAPVLNEDPKIADYEPMLPPSGSTLPFGVCHDDHSDTITTAEQWRRHRAPHAVWKSLTTNTPRVNIVSRVLLCRWMQELKNLTASNAGMRRLSPIGIR